MDFHYLKTRTLTVTTNVLKIVKHLILVDYYLIFQIKISLKRSDKYVALSNLSIYYIWESIKKSYLNNKLKISSPTWNSNFKLPDGSYSVSRLFSLYHQKT